MTRNLMELKGERKQPTFGGGRRRGDGSLEGQAKPTTPDRQRQKTARKTEHAVFSRTQTVLLSDQLSGREQASTRFHGVKSYTVCSPTTAVTAGSSPTQCPPHTPPCALRRTTRHSHGVRAACPPSSLIGREAAARPPPPQSRQARRGAFLLCPRALP